MLPHAQRGSFGVFFWLKNLLPLSLDDHPRFIRLRYHLWDLTILLTAGRVQLLVLHRFRADSAKLHCAHSVVPPAGN